MLDGATVLYGSASELLATLDYDFAVAATINDKNCSLIAKNAVEKIKSVTPQDIMDCANKYFNDKFVLTVLKP